MVGLADLKQMIENGRTDQVLGDRAIERSGDDMCGLHRACRDEEHEFLG
jgi:hypothetical protein